MLLKNKDLQEIAMSMHSYFGPIIEKEGIFEYRRCAEMPRSHLSVHVKMVERFYVEL